MMSVWGSLAGSVLWCVSVAAQAAAPDAAARIEALRAQIAALRSEQQAQIAEIQRRTDERIGAIEAAMAALTGETAPARVIGAVVDNVAPVAAPKLDVSGDFRLRYEANASSSAAPTREREVLRARLAGRYELSDWLTIGARLATGDPDDPNSTDVTLSDFVDDLSVTLDQAFLRMHRGGLDAYAGKFPNPFLRTELVWDGDVNPQGIGGSWSAGKLRVTGLHFLINEQAAGAESVMTGAQLGLHDVRWREGSFTLSAAYYDYDLEGTAGADAGDVRSNMLAPGGMRYLSDFDLFDVLAIATLETAYPAWPLKLVTNFVHNTGAATGADSAYWIEAALGRGRAPRDFRFTYGYALAETDAMLAAFSHDNTTLGTNYRQHSLAVDYLPLQNFVLNATWYHYRVNDPGLQSAEWLDRLRLNVLFEF